MSDSNTAPLTLSIAQVARTVGWSQREMRDRLWEEHEKRGKTLLFRRSSKPRAMLWVDATQLPDIFPIHFAAPDAAETRSEIELRMAIEGLRIACDRVLGALARTDTPTRGRRSSRGRQRASGG